MWSIGLDARRSWKGVSIIAFRGISMALLVHAAVLHALYNSLT